MRIIFQDIDGPLIPLRMYFNGNRPFDMKAGSFVYDPVAIGMLRALCAEFDAKVVFNSAHNDNGAAKMAGQANYNNFADLLHKDCITRFPSEIDGRLNAITAWLSEHPEVIEWIVIDDMPVSNTRQVKIDFNLGMTMNSFQQARMLFGAKPQTIIGIGQIPNHNIVGE